MESLSSATLAQPPALQEDNVFNIIPGLNSCPASHPDQHAYEAVPTKPFEAGTSPPVTTCPL